PHARAASSKTKIDFATLPLSRLLWDIQSETRARFAGRMAKAMTRSLILIAIFGLVHTSAVAQDCYFNLTTFQPPNPAVCYAQQSVPTPQTSSIRYRGRQAVKLHTKH